MKAQDEQFMRHTFNLALKARNHGNLPFSAILVDSAGQILFEAENTFATTGDCTGHAELNVLRKASQTMSPDELAGCTLYASAEPCPMCAAATVFSRVHRVIFGISTHRLNAYRSPSINLTSNNIFSNATSAIEVIGPVLEDEAAEVHQGFWKSS